MSTWVHRTHQTFFLNHNKYRVESEACLVTRHGFKLNSKCPQKNNTVTNHLGILACPIGLHSTPTPCSAFDISPQLPVSLPKQPYAFSIPRLKKSTPPSANPIYLQTKLSGAHHGATGRAGPENTRTTSWATRSGRYASQQSACSQHRPELRGSCRRLITPPISQIVPPYPRVDDRDYLMQGLYLTFLCIIWKLRLFW